MKYLLILVTLLSISGAIAEESMLKVNCKGMKGFACGDLNGDGRPDLALCSMPEKDGGEVLIYYQQSNGTFKAEPDHRILFPKAHDVAIADFNGDGKNDLACVNYHPELRIYFAQDGFQTSVSSTSSNQWRPQIAVFPSGNDKTRYILCGAVLHRITPDGKIQNTTITMLQGQKGINQRPIICDLNLDGNPDVIMSTYPGKADKPGFNIYYNFLANLNMKSRILRGSDFVEFCNLPTLHQLNYLSADVNGDNVPDLVYSTPAGIFYFPQDRFDGFSKCGEPEMLARISYPWILYDDFTGNGKELAAVTRNQIQYYRLPEKTPVRTQKFTQFTAVINGLKTCDIDNDGKPEILIGTASALWVIKPQ